MKYHCRLVLSYSTSWYVLPSGSNTKYPSLSLTSFQWCYMLVARITQLERVLDGGCLGTRIGSEL
jgi:hypothetical protein